MSGALSPAADDKGKWGTGCGQKVLHRSLKLVTERELHHASVGCGGELAEVGGLRQVE